VRQTTAIEGYAGATSVAPGDTLELHVAAAVPARYRIEVYRLGWYRGLGARRVACLPSCDGDRAAPLELPRPVPDPATGIARAGWPVTDTLTPSPLWVSGYYEARLVVTSGAASGGSYSIFFVVREPLLRASAILVQVPVNTWQAYNSWAGKSLYGFSSDGSVAANRTASLAADPRVRVEIFRHAGSDAFAPGDPGNASVCTAGRESCLDRAVAPGAMERYAACEVDAWGTSVALLSAPVARRRPG
jgi:hypothetical protein